MHRQMILELALGMAEKKGNIHGDYDKNMDHIGMLIGLFCEAVLHNDKLPSSDDCPGFYAAMELCLIKISRIACGQPNPDDFVDGCNYLAQAGSMLLDWQEKKDTSQNGTKLMGKVAEDTVIIT